MILHHFSTFDNPPRVPISSERLIKKIIFTSSFWILTKRKIYDCCIVTIELLLPLGGRVKTSSMGTINIKGVINRKGYQFFLFGASDRLNNLKKRGN